MHVSERPDTRLIDEFARADELVRWMLPRALAFALTMIGGSGGCARAYVSSREDRSQSSPEVKMGRGDASLFDISCYRDI
jgi:hypothetical protein